MLGVGAATYRLGIHTTTANQNLNTSANSPVRMKQHFCVFASVPVKLSLRTLDEVVRCTTFSPLTLQPLNVINSVHYS